MMPWRSLNGDRHMALVLTEPPGMAPLHPAARSVAARTSSHSANIDSAGCC